MEYVILALLSAVFIIGIKKTVVKKTVSKSKKSIHYAMNIENLIRFIESRGREITIFQISVAFEIDEATAELWLNTAASNGFLRRFMSNDGRLIYALKESQTDYKLLIADSILPNNS